VDGRESGDGTEVRGDAVQLRDAGRVSGDQSVCKEGNLEHVSLKSFARESVERQDQLIARTWGAG
jgi:hypothetical protein